MKSATKEIPILEGADLHKIHFGRRLAEFPFESTHFYAQRLEENRKKINFPLPPHRKTVHDLIFITHGQSVRSKGLNEYAFGKNQIFCQPALQITDHKSMSEDVKGYFVHFSSDLFAEMPNTLNSFQFLKFHSEPVIVVSEQALEPLKMLFERLIQLYADEQLRDEKLLIRGYLLAVFSEMSYLSGSRELDKRDTAAILTQKYKDGLSQHIYSYRTVAEFSELLHVTPNHLNKCVKKTLNKTAQDLLNEMLMLEAKSLLKYSDLSVLEISHKLFKSTPSNFSRFFKSLSGMTPLEFRKG